MLAGTGGETVQDAGEDRGVDVIEAGEQLGAVAVSGQDLAQRGDQGGPVGAGAELVEGAGELVEGAGELGGGVAGYRSANASVSGAAGSSST